MRQLRHFLWLAILTGLLTQSALAQTSRARYPRTTTRVGLQLGAAMSTINAQGSKLGDRTAPIVGVNLVLGYAPYLGTQVEVSYVSKGSGGDDFTYFADTAAVTDENLRLNYLQFALLGRLGGIVMPDDRRASFVPRVYGGPAFAYLLSSKWYNRTDLTDFGLQTTDISMILGAGADIEVGDRLIMTIDYRFDFGIREVIGSLKNRTSTLMIGVSF